MKESLLSRDKPPVCLHALGQGLVNTLWEEGHALRRAASVIALTPRTKEWLQDNDPKALDQLERALNPEQDESLEELTGGEYRECECGKVHHMTVAMCPDVEREEESDGA